MTAALVVGYLLCGLGTAVALVRWCWDQVSEFGPGTFAERYLPNSTLAGIVLLWPLVLVVAVVVLVVTLANEAVVRTGRRGRGW